MSEDSRNIAWPVAIAMTIVAAALLVVGAAREMDREPTGPDSGDRLSGGHTTARSTRSPGTLRVATFNIRRGVGLDGCRDTGRIAHQLEGVDLVGLNEVDGQDDDAANQAAALGMKLGMNWLYAPSERMRGRDNIGNAVLTNLPATGYTRLPMRKTKPDGYRNIVLLNILLDGMPVHVIVTHTDGSEDRDAQLKLATELFQSLQPPAILMGDFNTQSDHPTLRALLDRPDVEESLSTTKTPARPDRIDWLFTRGLHITAAGFDDRGYSDHPMIWAEMKLKN